MAKQPEPVEAEAPKKGGGFKRFLTLLLVAIIMAAAGFGGGMFMRANNFPRRKRYCG